MSSGGTGVGDLLASGTFDRNTKVLFRDNASASWLYLPGMCTADMEILNPKCASIYKEYAS